MTKTIALLVLAAALPQVVAAQFNPSGVQSASIDTVVEALNAPNETTVALTGNILERIRSETYLFSDDTGEIRLDIGEEIWAGVAVGPEMRVRIVGETDRGLSGTEIWVHSVEAVGSADDPD